MRGFIKIEGIVLAALVLGFSAGSIFFARHVTAKREALVVRAWMHMGDRHAVSSVDEHKLMAATASVELGSPLETSASNLFSSEVRVIAVGSGFPISYDATVCPFSGILQPRDDQLDRDGDRMSDSWERRYGLNAQSAADAEFDLDADGFSNREEFLDQTDPSSASDHSPYILKMRFVKQRDVPFPFVFMGTVRLPDGRTVMQLNSLASGRTYFRSVGGAVKGVVVEKYIPKRQGEKSYIIVAREGVKIKLPRGKKIPDPKSQGELINVLDSQTIVATVGALLSLRNDDYTVLSVSPDKVEVQRLKTGKVYEVIGFSEGEREAQSQRLKK